VTQDSCGEFCEESEVLRTETRFELWADVGLGAGTEGRVDTIRGALGTTPGEARAVLERTAFQRASGPLRIEGAPYATWPHPKACAAVEVRSLEGEVLLLDTRCTDLPEDDALGRTIEERLDGENTPDAPARNRRWWLPDQPQLAPRGGAWPCWVCCAAGGVCDPLCDTPSHDAWRRAWVRCHCAHLGAGWFRTGRHGGVSRSA
jgi:hypothetical protein